MKDRAFYGWAKNGRPLLFPSWVKQEKSRRIWDEVLMWLVAATGVMAVLFLAVLLWFPHWID